MARKKHKLSRKQRRLKHKVTFRTLLLLSVTLIFNTYAWFVYATTVSTNLTAHVDAWKIEFEVDNNLVQREINFIINHAYPGMTDQVQTVVITNTGEKAADVDYEMKMVRIFDDIYLTSEYAQELGGAPTGSTILTHEQLVSKMLNDYPFTLTLTVSQGTLQIRQSTNLTSTFAWDYESGQDSTDTDFGERAAQYYEDNNGAPVIQVLYKILVTQHQ